MFMRCSGAAASSILDVSFELEREEGMRTQKRLVTLCAVSAALFVLTGLPAVAVDGVLEISQACVAVGCFPGDSPGFPVTITQPGSYRLTSNLTVPDENTTAIGIYAGSAQPYAPGSVDLDLNGFTVSGVTTCANIVPVHCTPTGTGEGIVDGPPSGVVEVHDGVVRGMGSHGVDLESEGARIEGVVAIENGGGGVRAIAGGVIRRVEAVRNGGDGIASGNGAVVADSRARENLGSGIVTLIATIMGNAVTENGGDGISAEGGSLVESNSVSRNDGDGVRITVLGPVTGDPATVVDNTIIVCGGDGVDGSIGVVSGNTISYCTGFGIRLDTDGGYSNNVVTENNGGNANPQVSGGTELGTNLCGTNTTCP